MKTIFSALSHIGEYEKTQTKWKCRHSLHFILLLPSQIHMRIYVKEYIPIFWRTNQTLTVVFIFMSLLFKYNINH
jgi:hypothetical protein